MQRNRRHTKRSERRITAWSFSRYATYQACPAQASYKFIDKLSEGEPGAALVRGKDIHKLAEHYGLGKLKELPTELQKFEAEFQELRKLKKFLQVECQLAADRHWEATSWFGSDTWVRIVVDALLIRKSHARAIDYKTGKIKSSHEEQLDLYAIVLFQLYPQLETVTGELWYTDLGDLIELEYQRSELEELKAEWEEKVRPMLTDSTFKPTPNDGCRWCYFSKSKGGPCQY